MTKEKLIQQIMAMSFDKLIANCYSFVRTATSISELQMSPSFSLTNREIDLLEEAQPSQDDYEKVIFHFALNLLAPEGCKNGLYTNTRRLFEVCTYVILSRTATNSNYRQLSAKLKMKFQKMPRTKR